MGMDLAASSVVSRMFRTGTCLLFSGVCLSLLLSPSSWFQTNLLPGRRPLYLLLHRPRGLVSCTTFPFVFVTSAIGDLVASSSFLTSWLRPRILPFLTLASRSSQCRPLTTLLVVIGTNCCSVPSEPFISTGPGRSSTSQVSKGCSSQQGEGVLEHHFLLAVLCYFLGSCVRFGKRLSVPEDQSS